MKAFAAILALLALAWPAKAGEFTYPILSGRVENSTVTIYTDIDALAPALAGQRIDARTLQLLWRGRPEQFAAFSAAIAADRQLTLGHARLYYYLAVNLAFQRTFERSLAFEPGLDSLQALAGLTPLHDAHLRVEIYTDEARFRARTARLNLHSAQAFWEPQTATIGIYSNPRIFRWLRTQVGTALDSTDSLVTILQDFVFTRSIGDIGHEIIHFAQDNASPRAVRSAFLAEGAATFFQQSMAARQDVTMLLRAQGRSEAQRAECEGLRQLMPAPSDTEMLVDQTRAAAPFALGAPDAPSLSLLLRTPSNEFYAQPPERLKSSYVLANMAMLYFSSMQREELAAVFPNAPANTRFMGFSGDAALDSAFARFAARQYTLAGAPEERLELYLGVQSLVDLCLRDGDYLSAYYGSRLLVQLAPEHVDGHIYLGDVYWYARQPLIALDHYARAGALLNSDEHSTFYTLIESRSGRDSEVVVAARLGDALMTAGDIELASARLQTIADLGAEDVDGPPVLTLLRAHLKREYLAIAAGQQRAPEQIPYMLAESYVYDFQGGPCDGGLIADPDYVEALLQTDLPRMRQIASARYEAVRRAMAAELAATSDWAGLMSRRLAERTACRSAE